MIVVYIDDFSKKIFLVSNQLQWYITYATQHDVDLLLTSYIWISWSFCCASMLCCTVLKYLEIAAQTLLTGVMSLCISGKYNIKVLE